MGNGAFGARSIPPALGDDPVANQILIEAHDVVFLLFSPAYDQLRVTLILMKTQPSPG